MLIPVGLICQALMVTCTSAYVEDYVDFSDMGNYDHGVQRNIGRKMSQLGMVPPVAQIESMDTGSCESSKTEACQRSMEYLQRIVKSLLRQMNVHSHVFGPGEAITIDLQAEIKYDDYVVLTKFMNSKQESDKYLHRVDSVMSNFIHVVEHTSSRFEFLDSIVNFPAFYSLKFWVILLTTMVICSLIVMLFLKAFYTPSVHVQLVNGFLIIFILSCVWSFSNMYEDKKAEVMAHMIQISGEPPKDCDYQSFNMMEQMVYWFRVNVFKYKDQCSEYYANSMTDPFWKVNPMQAISTSAAFFFFEPLGYIGEKMGSFYTGFIRDAPWLLKPILLVVAIFLTVLMIYGPFRISTPILTIEPAWRPIPPALERSPVQILHAIGHERIRNEIMERPDGPVVKSIRDATTDMDGFMDYLSDEGSDEIEINGPLSRFNLPESPSKDCAYAKSEIRVDAKVSVLPDDNPSLRNNLNKDNDTKSLQGNAAAACIVEKEQWENVRSLLHPARVESILLKTDADIDALPLP